jgi:signal transduction histidine kinase/DNA-binding response OmpR family regulator/ligand-binding sensor domain-containing protein
MPSGKLICTTLTLAATLIVCYWQPALTQEPILNQYAVGTPEDLSHYQTWCLHQDSRGFLWIGTLGGLDRWDGAKIKKYTYTPFDTTGLPVIGIMAIEEDKDYNLWLGSRVNGLLKFNLETEEFTQFYDPLTDPERWNIREIKYDDKGFLWLGTNYGLYRYYISEDRFERVPYEGTNGSPDSSLFQIQSIIRDTTGLMWIASMEGLFFLNSSTGYVTRFDYRNEKLPGGTLTEVLDITIDTNGIIWMLQGRSELVKFDPYSQKVDFIWPQRYEKHSAYADGCIHALNDGRLLFGLANGLMEYDQATNTVSNLTDEPDWISDVLVDNQNNIIVTTWHGVKIFDTRAASMRMLSRDFLQYHNYSITSITDIASNGSQCWVTTLTGGVVCADLKNGNVRLYNAGTNLRGLQSDNAYRVFFDKKGDVWIMAGTTLHHYNPGEDYFTPFPLLTPHYITIDREGMIWLASNDRIIRFDAETYDTVTWVLSSPLPTNQAGMVGTDSYGFIRDREGCLWLGSKATDGLIRINPKSKSWVRYQYNVNNENGIPSNNIHRLYYDSEDRLWAGTMAGLSLITIAPDTYSIHCRNYFVSDGLINNEVCGITEDVYGNIWAGTFKGISILTPDSKVINLTSLDGLPEKDLHVWILKTDCKGNIFAGVKDIVVIPPSFDIFNGQIPGVYITDLSVSGKKMIPGKKSPLAKSATFTDRIDLKHDQNFITFNYAALNFTHSEKNQYKYILEGVDKDTVNAQGRDYAEYTGLRHGRYTFWVTGSNNTGNWNREGVSWSIRIHPPWYLSITAKTFYIMLLLLTGYYYRLFLIQRGREKAELAMNEREMVKMREIDSLKSHFFSNISHEFRTPLTLILGNTERLIQTAQDESWLKDAYNVIRRNANRLLRLVNQLLDLSRLDARLYKLNICQSDVSATLRTIASSFVSVAGEKDIEFGINLPEKVMTCWFDKDIIEKVLYNLLSNAFKFTPQGGKVFISATLEKGVNGLSPDVECNVLIIRVEDTGIGIADEERERIFDRFYQIDKTLKSGYEGTGVGLSLTREILLRCNGSIVVTGEPGSGSTFEVMIPVDRFCFREEDITEEEPADVTHHVELDNIIPAQAPYKDSPGSDKTGDQAKNRSLMLVVEDHNDMRSFIADIFRKDYSVICASNGSIGAVMAIENIPDIIVTDLMMPVRNGLEMCSILKKDERTSHIPIVMLTAKATVEERIEGLELGADDYLPKPFNARELVVRVKNLIEQRKRLQKQFSRSILLEPRGIVINSTDEIFIGRIVTAIEENIASEKLGVEFLSAQIGFSRVQLYRKVKALTGESVQSFIRNYRLKRASELLRKGYGTVSEVAFASGFNNLSYFTRCFREFYGKSPSELGQDI